MLLKATERAYTAVLTCAPFAKGESSRDRGRRFARVACLCFFWLGPYVGVLEN